jgi:1-acyl-sn-glycerol-3-phosphate acyltransferase
MSRRNAATDEPWVPAGERGFSRGILYSFLTFLSRLLGLVFFGVRVFHQERVPKAGPTLIACNHQSFLDPWLVGMSTDRAFCFMARSSLFRIPGLGWLLPRLNTFPVPRENLVPKAAMEASMKILEKNRAIVMFPEGTRSLDGRLQPLRRGAALLAKRSRASVVPTFLRGPFRSWPRTAIIPRAGNVEIIFGDAMTYEEKESLDSFTDRLSNRLTRLAIELGAFECLPNESCSGEKDPEVKEPSLVPPSDGSPLGLPETGEARSLATSTTGSIDGGPARGGV